MKKTLLILKWIFLALLMILFFASCRSLKQKESTTTTDSTSVKIVDRLMMVEIPGEDLIIESTIECDSLTNKPKPFKKVTKANYVRQLITLDSAGKLHTECECLEQIKQIKVQDTEISRLKKVLIEKEKEKPTRAPVPWYDKACRTFTGLVIVAIAFYSIGKYYNITK